DERNDPVEGLVHRRPRQVVHGRIDNAEVLFLAWLGVEHLGHAGAGIADQRASRFDDEPALSEAAGIEARQQLFPKRIRGGRRVAVVVDAQTTAEVEMVQRDAGLLDRLDQVQDAFERFEVGRRFGDLRADMAVYAHPPQPGQGSGVAVDRDGPVVRDAELVALETGRDVRMRLRVDVGIDAYADRRPSAFL